MSVFLFSVSRVSVSIALIINIYIYQIIQNLKKKKKNKLCSQPFLHQESRRQELLQSRSASGSRPSQSPDPRSPEASPEPRHFSDTTGRAGCRASWRDALRTVAWHRRRDRPTLPGSRPHCKPGGKQKCEVILMRHYKQPQT